MTKYPELNALRKKDAKQAVASAASGKPATSMAQNPLAVKKIKKRKSRRTVLRVAVLVLALFFVTSSVFAARMLTVGGGLFNDDSDGFFSQLRALFGNTSPLIGESQDRVNVLLLGRGGEGHDGPNLTDTMILASIRPSTNDVALLSIPRDLYVEIPNFGYNKLNSAFALGEDYDYPGGGARLATETIEQITEQEIPYYVTIDFTGFEQIVDELGGINVDVPRPFYDNLHDLEYDAGQTRFDGAAALYFVRARYVDGPEGGDFARAGRTQLIGLAIRDKALELNPVADIATITGLLQNVGDHVRTNLNPAELRRVYELAHEIPVDGIQTRVIDDAETNLLYGDTGQIGGINVSVLKPNDSTFGEIQRYALGMFDPLPPEDENAILEIHNGTEEVGIAGAFADSFELSLQIAGVDNANRSDYDQTFIVDTTDGEKPTSLGLLESYLEDLGLTDVRVVGTERYSSFSAADFIVVLGKDYLNVVLEP